jgi:hypothetical protein
LPLSYLDCLSIRRPVDVGVARARGGCTIVSGESTTNAVSLSECFKTNTEPMNEPLSSRARLCRATSAVGTIAPAGQSRFQDGRHRRERMLISTLGLPSPEERRPDLEIEGLPRSLDGWASRDGSAEPVEASLSSCAEVRRGAGVPGSCSGRRGRFSTNTTRHAEAPRPSIQGHLPRAASRVT